MIVGVGKKRDPNYGEIRGFVPIKLLQRFKGLCKQLGVEHGDVLTPFIEQWVKQTESRLASEETEPEQENQTQ